MSTVKKSMITAINIALCVVLPMAFHAIENGGRIFSPMHIPVLLCGLICGWPYGLLTGIAGPLLSSLFTGMPPMAILPQMMVELATYGVVAGLMMEYVHTGKVFADLYISLITALIAGRVVAGLTGALIFSRGSITMASWVTSYFVTAFPGIVLHLAVIPPIVYMLMKANLIPNRYPSQNIAAE
ncbi:ECF transporter S component [Fundicoccus culcitae]|uniref:ECF transporter S component n=1 Tax=Fundicoccus culcitae TaxID=2969821 RepID=A0ABY5P7U7_9LACT|nr:ECF transporter S component [Fundicoccus culcitae]UUX34729.1 ECF transporter S component [Fundicoccus culcitae]